jgi:hypothetical protein
LQLRAHDVLQPWRQTPEQPLEQEPPQAYEQVSQLDDAILSSLACEYTGKLIIAIAPMMGSVFLAACLKNSLLD